MNTFKILFLETRDEKYRYLELTDYPGHVIDLKLKYLIDTTTYSEDKLKSLVKIEQLKPQKTRKRPDGGNRG